jgi:hypothetical protein
MLGTAEKSVKMRKSRGSYRESTSKTKIFLAAEIQVDSSKMENG